MTRVHDDAAVYPPAGLVGGRFSNCVVLQSTERKVTSSVSPELVNTGIVSCC